MLKFQNTVATSSPHAAGAAQQAFSAGGNAIDAALAAAIALCVVEPVSTGIGDLMAIIWDGTQVHGLNASGRLPRAWTRKARDGALMPMLGWQSVVVPGAVSGWQALSLRFGDLPFAEVFKPAIAMADKGFQVPEVTAAKWAKRAPGHARQPGFRALFMPGGKAPAAGEIWRNPALADTLGEIAQSAGEAFYRGRIAGEMVRCASAQGGSLGADDLAGHRPEWVAPLSMAYRGYRVHQLPAPCQGSVALMALGILERFDLKALGTDSPESIHLQIEAVKTAFDIAYDQLADSDRSRELAVQWLEDCFLDQCAARITPGKASGDKRHPPPWGGTVQVCTADANGRMVSLIQSNFDAFGSGVVIPSLGLHLNNRAACFSLTPGHPNEVCPGGRPFNTIMPGFVTNQGQPLLSLGVTGGPIQPQGQVQVLHRLIDGRMAVQSALDHPRWKIEHARSDVQVDLEAGFPLSTARTLRQWGHAEGPPGITGLDFGGAFAILNTGDTFQAGADRRRDKGLAP